LSVRVRVRVRVRVDACAENTTSWLSLRPAGAPEASLSARACLRLPQAPTWLRPGSDLLPAGLVPTYVLTEPLVVLQVVVTVPVEADGAHLRVARADHLRPPLGAGARRVEVRPPRVEPKDRQREALQRRARRRVSAHPVRRVGAIGDAGHGRLRRHLEVRRLAVGDERWHRRLGDHAVPHARPVVASATYRGAPVLVERKLVLCIAA
jgi:hypothetical protein